MEKLTITWFPSYLKSLSLGVPFSPASPNDMKYHNKIQNFAGNLSKSRKNEERCSDDFRIFDFETTCFSEAGLPPVTLSYSRECGRFIEASRDIEAGETIFWEPPLVLCPKGGSGPTCLKCFLSFTESNWPVCEQCKCPKCKSCNGNEHDDLECKLLADAFKDTDISNNVSKVKLLNIILTPLRTYIALKKSPELEQIVKSLQSNASKRKNTSIGQFIDKYVAIFFQNEANLNVDSEFVHHVCGVFDTNAFDVTIEFHKQARALLPLASLMNHSCVPNTQHWFIFGSLVVRASVFIKKGEMITNSYTHALWGTKNRKNHLAMTKFFKCNCKRCIDPSELGSNFSSIRCQMCKEDLVLPTTKELLSCNSCSESTPLSSAVNIVNVASGVVSRAETMDLDTVSKTIQQLSRMIGSQHFSTVKLQFIYLKKIIHSLMKANTGDLLGTVPLIESLLQLAGKIEPGLTRTKGFLLFCKCSVQTELLRRGNQSQNSDGQNDVHGFLNALSSEEIKNLLDECEIILKWDPLLEDLQEVRSLWKTLSGNVKVCPPNTGEWTQAENFQAV